MVEQVGPNIRQCKSRGGDLQQMNGEVGLLVEVDLLVVCVRSSTFLLRDGFLLLLYLILI